MESKFQDDNGVIWNVRKLKDEKGNDRYLFEDLSGNNLPFTWTPEGDPQQGDPFTPEQKRFLEKFRKEI
jgi:hypothetical protein